MATLSGSASCLGDDTVLLFAQGELERVAADRVTGHIDDCPACRELVAEACRALLEERTDALTRPDRAKPSAFGSERSGLAGGHSDGDAAIGRYRLLCAIGRGGMGVVYAAYDPQLRRKIAVKVLRPDAGGPAGEIRLLREAQAMAQLSHPNVVQVYDAGVAGGEVFVAMELVDGMTLSRWLRGRRTWRDAMAAFVDAGRGLAAAHGAGLVHRDFKPANVLLSADGRVRVTDFGLARTITAGEEGSGLPPPPAVLGVPVEVARAVGRLTETGALAGTPPYMAPEQFEGRPPDARADQFAFSVALYEALYRVHPFAGALDTPAPSLLGTLEPAPELTEVPPTVFEVLRRALSREPDSRYDSMNDLLTDLERAAALDQAGPRLASAGAPSSSSPAMMPSPEAGRRSGRRAASLAVIAAGAGVLAMIGFSARPDPAGLWESSSSEAAGVVAPSLSAEPSLGRQESLAPSPAPRPSPGPTEEPAAPPRPASVEPVEPVEPAAAPARRRTGRRRRSAPAPRAASPQRSAESEPHGDDELIRDLWK